jgi:hypothetical protein
LLGGGSEGEEASQSSGSQANSDVDFEQLSGDTSLPAVQTNRKSYGDDEYASRTIPVEVNITSSDTADLIFKGALATPNWSLSATPPEYLDLIMVFQFNTPSLLEEKNGSIVVNYLDTAFTIELLDASGNTLFNYDWGTADGLIANWPQHYRYYNPEIPEGVASARVSVSFERMTLGSTCFEAEDLDFQIPSPVFYHTPVQYELTLDDWGEEYAEKSVVADYNLVYQNPYKIDMIADSMVLFLDDAGNLVGYMQQDVYIPANNTYARVDGDHWQSSYLSGVPTQVQIYDDFNLCDLTEANR